MDRLDRRGRRTSSATASTTRPRAASRGGGTQEFVGDTFGAATECVRQQPAPTPPDFLVGEEVNLVGQGPIRNMYNPSAVGDPNCYSSSIPSAEVHAAAGPGNHWFYLLAEGSNPSNGQPASPTCNGSTVTGIGIQKAHADHGTYSSCATCKIPPSGHLLQNFAVHLFAHCTH